MDNQTRRREPLIRAEHLSFSYPDEKAAGYPVLNDVSLTIERGSFVCLIGHNGSGKSTLAKLLNQI